MKEFGSDFHFMTVPYKGNGCLVEEKYVRYYADGRHAIQHLLYTKLQANEWKRIWLPEYFCYDVVHAIKDTGIQILYYPDTPLADDDALIDNITFENGDVLFRMNYFGFRAWRDNSRVNVPVIEDHSHDLISGWAKRSNADYCVASLRKTLPIPEGGILWSPKSLSLPIQLPSSVENEALVYKRTTAMLLKNLYLKSIYADKDVFRRLFVDSEKSLAELALCGCSEFVLNILHTLETKSIYSKKKENWLELVHLLNNDPMVLQPLSFNDSMTPFACVMLFHDRLERERIRANLIANNIYPAILWNIPLEHTDDVVKLSERLLIIHCDYRYSLQDMRDMFVKIKMAIEN